MQGELVNSVVVLNVVPNVVPNVMLNVVDRRGNDDDVVGRDGRGYGRGR